MPVTCSITVVCALPSEARPLIDRYRLSRITEIPFRAYAGDGMRVIVSGIGIAPSAAAVGFGAGLATPLDNDVWINVGIAGHRDLPLGSAVLGSRITHHGQHAGWYPSLLFETALPATEIVSYDAPVTDYPPAACCDMEAAGFMAAASRVACGDLIQVMKIVSDNQASGLGHIDREFIHELVSAQLPAFDALCDRLRECAAELPPPAADNEVDAILERWHFTATDRARLRTQFRRLRALGAAQPMAPAALEDCRSAREVIERIDLLLRGLAPRLAP